jgi:hypothetical protein
MASADLWYEEGDFLFAQRESYKFEASKAPVPRAATLLSEKKTVTAEESAAILKAEVEYYRAPSRLCSKLKELTSAKIDSTRELPKEKNVVTSETTSLKSKAKVVTTLPAKASGELCKRPFRFPSTSKISS